MTTAFPFDAKATSTITATIGVRVDSLRGRMRRWRSLKHGYGDWVACLGLSITVREYAQFKSSLARSTDLIARLQQERPASRRMP